MSVAEALAAEFVRVRPGAAARALEPLAAPISAAFLLSLDARAGAALLREFLPPRAARCMEQMPDAQLLAIFRFLPTAAVATLLRRVDSRRRHILLPGLGRVRAGLIEVLLNYPENMIGAWADPGAPLLREGMRVGDAQRLMRSEPELSDDRLFVVDAMQRVCASVSTTRLASAKRRHRIENIAEQEHSCLLASTRIEDALSDTCWRDTRCVAVADPRGELVGVLRYARLLEALGQDTPQASVTRSDSGADLVEILFGGVSAEWDAWSDLVSQEQRGDER